MSRFQCLDPPPPRRPRVDVPAGAWDCHFHVFDAAAGTPLASEARYDPPQTPLAAALALHDGLGIARGTIVQASVYGTDNRVLKAALAEARGRYRGVAVVAADAADRELDELQALGVRGVRICLPFPGGPGLEAAPLLAPKLKARGWHLQLLLDAADPATPWPMLERLGVPLVIDHFGFVAAAAGPRQPAFRDLVARCRDGLAWVKLSGPMRISKRPAPAYDDVRALALALAEAVPDRLVFGTDWPHVSLPAPLANAGDLVDLLAEWLPDPGLRRRVLADNPARLYA